MMKPQAIALGILLCASVAQAGKTELEVFNGAPFRVQMTDAATGDYTYFLPPGYSKMWIEYTPTWLFFETNGISTAVSFQDKPRGRVGIIYWTTGLGGPSIVTGKQV